MSRKGVQAVSDKISSPPSPPTTTPTTPLPVSAPHWLLLLPCPVWVNPPLDEEWRAPPPPTTPPDYIDPSKEEIAQ